MRRASDPDLIGADDVALLLGINRKSVLAGAARREIPHRRVGRLMIFSRRAITAWAHHEPADRATNAGCGSPRHEEEA